MLCVGVAQGADSETLQATFPVSLNSTGIFADNGTTGLSPSISDDGRYVVFASAASNLGGGGPAGIGELYLKDLGSGKVELISRASGVDGEPADAPAGEGIEKGIISGDGRYAIFTSDASNLATGLPAEELEERHVYRRDLQTGETQLVDRVSGAQGAILNREARAEAISDGGRYVVFSDHVSDLEDPAGLHEPGERIVYVRDMSMGTTTTVSRSAGAQGAIADANSSASSISPGGRYVAFVSTAENLVAGTAGNTIAQVYLRDLKLQTTTLVSAALPAGDPGDAPSNEAILVGPDGCEVAFESAATNLYPQATEAAPQIYLRDLCSTPPSITVVSRADGRDGLVAGASSPEALPHVLGASVDGARVLFSAGVEGLIPGAGSLEHLYLRDLRTGQSTLLDRSSEAQGAIADQELANGGFQSAALSANGCRATFATAATNLDVSPSGGGFPEVYVRQLASCQPPAESVEEAGSADGPRGEQTGITAAQGDSGPNMSVSSTTPSARSGEGIIQPVRMTLGRLSARGLMLNFSSSARAGVEVARRVGSRHHRYWRVIKSIAITASKAGWVEVKLAHLPSGRYRIGVGLTGGHSIYRELIVPGHHHRA